MYNRIVWDFNGTLLCDMQAGIDSVNEMLSERGLETIPGVDEYREIFDFPIYDYYKRLGFDFEKEDYYTVLAPAWVELYLEKSKSSPLCDGVPEVLKYIKERKIPQTVLSATEINMLNRQIAELGIGEYFDELFGLDNIHAGSKLRLAEQWRELHEGEKVLMIGDTTHDAEVARAIGADCVLYSGGHMSGKRLEACRVPVVDDLREIIKFLK